MPDLEKPDNQNNFANQKQQGISLPQHLPQDNNTTSQQQTIEENKIHPCQHKNELFKEPTAHEKNSLLSSLKSKLDNIDEIIKKAKQNRNAAIEETKQKIHSQEPSNAMQQIAVLSNQIQESQNNAVEQTVMPKLESKPENTNTKELSHPMPPVTPKDYSNITTFAKADEAIKAEPENYKHYVARANLYIKKQDYKNSEIDYKTAQELTQSKDVAVLTGLAKVYDLSGQPSVALEIYSKALELNPLSTEILNNRAHCYETLGQEENFFKDIEKAIEIEPNNPKNYISRAEHYMAKNNFQKSLEDVNKIVELKPENASARYFRGVLNYNLKNYQDCFNDMQKSLELKTGENEVYRYLGICSYKASNFSDAINFLKKAIELGFDDANVYYYRAYAQFNSAAFDAALGDADKSIEEDSQKYEYYLLRAKIYNEKNIIDKSEKDYNKALKLNASFNIFVERAEFFTKHNKYKEALKDYTSAITLNNQNAEIYKQRGYVYQKLNKNEEAEADFEQALKLNPPGDVSVENKNILQLPPQQDPSQIKQETPANTETLVSLTTQIAQANIEPLKNNSQDITVASKNQPSPKQQDTQSHKEQQIETPKNQTPQQQLPLAQQESKVEVKAEPQKIITPQENNEEKPKKIGLFARFLKKSNKESSESNNEISSSLPSLHPSDVEMAYNRANINYKNKKYALALDDLSKIFSKEPNYVKGYLLRANVYSEIGDTAKALEDLNKVIEFSPQTFLAYFKRAEIYFLQNNDDAAFADFEKTIELNQKFARGYVGIAKIYTKRANKEKAIENYNLAKKYDLKYSKIADAEIKALKQ
jgi:tetratricopeptide (TPR) repeat protein